MKRSLPFLLLPLMWVLAGCPVSVDYPLGYQDKDKIDNALIGTWAAADTSAEVQEVKISKIDEFTLAVEVTKRGSMYVEETDFFKGWCTTINNQKFVYFQNAGDNTQGYYSYNYWFEGKQLMTSDFALKVGGVDAVTSIEAYRQEVKASMEYEDFRGTVFAYNKTR
ncbi:MAG TPA: hypothetical protein PLL28_10715 [Chitinophagales bacterium]|nr:hypothetical protein [Chitinophagales bacterium]